MRLYRVGGSLVSLSLSLLVRFIIFFSFYVLHVSAGMSVYELRLGESNVRICALHVAVIIFPVDRGAKSGTHRTILFLVRNRVDVEMRAISNMRCSCIRDYIGLRCFLKYTRTRFRKYLPRACCDKIKDRGETADK